MLAKVRSQTGSRPLFKFLLQQMVLLARSRYTVQTLIQISTLVDTLNVVWMSIVQTLIQISTLVDNKRVAELEASRPLFKFILQQIPVAHLEYSCLDPYSNFYFSRQYWESRQGLVQTLIQISTLVDMVRASVEMSSRPLFKFLLQQMLALVLA